MVHEGRRRPGGPAARRPGGPALPTPLLRARHSCRRRRLQSSSWPAETDEVESFPEVLDAARLGQAWALRCLYDCYGSRVLGYVRGKGALEPDEVTNDVFAQAFTSLPRFEGDEPAFRSWLFTIAHRRVVDAYRRAGTQPETTPYDVESDRRCGPSAESAALDLVGEQRVRVLLDRLSPDQRDVLLLRLVGDLTVIQVAQALDKPPGAVKALQRRGLAQLAKALDAQTVTM